MRSGIIASAVATAVSAAGWGYDTQPWTSGYCQPTEYVRQSPIDIITKVAGTKDEQYDHIGARNFVNSNFRSANYSVMMNNITSSGAHSITFSFAEEVGDDNYSCPQFHCHFADSEHAVDGKKTFGECHTVCYNKAVYGSFGNALNTINGDELAVFGFFIEEDDVEDNEAVASWISAVNAFDAQTYMNTLVDVQIAVPDDVSKFYRYEGGLTTPGCNPIVEWTVFANSVKISSAQKLAMLSWSAGHLIGNNRAVQPLQDREITCFGCEDDSSDDEDCDGKKYVIRSDGTIRPEERDDVCAIAQHGHKEKLSWMTCESDMEYMIKWQFNQVEGEDYGYISCADDLVEEPMCWTIRSPKRARNQMVMLTPCKEQPRQQFIIKDGMIWFNESMERNYCVTFEGEGKFVRTRTCFDSSLGAAGSPADQDSDDQGSGNNNNNNTYDK